MDPPNWLSKLPSASLATNSGSQLPPSLQVFCQLSQWYHVGCICPVYICFSELGFPTSVFFELCVCLFIAKSKLLWCILENSSLPDVCLANVFFQCMASYSFLVFFMPRTKSRIWPMLGTYPISELQPLVHFYILLLIFISNFLFI